MLLFKQLPEWRQDNPYILRGYRPLTNSYWWCCRSLTYLHNQTLNIYTHLIGLVLFALLGHAFRYTLYSRYQTATHEDAFVFIIFFIGLFTCLAFSSAFHTFSSHCEDVCKHWLILDILGILCLVTASWVPGIYYGFYCQRGVALFYLTMVSLSSRMSEASDC
jgi:adiponectin receptor